MAPKVTFDELLAAVEDLPDDEQAQLADVIRRRLAERGRQRVIDEVRQGRREFAEGKCSVTTPDDFVGGINP